MLSPDKMKLRIAPLLILSLALPECGSKDLDQTRAESMRIDSLIKVRRINDRTLIVSFGYDAVSSLKTTKGIILIDAGISTSLTGRYRKLIEKEFDQQYFIYVINTHGHHDHIRGNSIFPEAHIIGQENCPEDAVFRHGIDSSMMDLGKIAVDYDLKLQHSVPGSSEWADNFTQKIRYAGARSDLENNIPFRLPDVPFRDSMRLECGDIAPELIWFGKFHSKSDALIYVPELKMLFTGDLFSKSGRPGFAKPPASEESRWIIASAWIRKRIGNIETVIDGHGDILSVADLESFLDRLSRSYEMPIQK